MTEATARELRERVSALELELATLRGLCPEGVRPVDYLRHLISDNRQWRELHGARSFEPSPHAAEWGG